MQRKPPPGIEVPEIPPPLSATTPRVDRNPQDPHLLPDHAQTAWPKPAPPRVAPAQRPAAPPAPPGPSRENLAEAIVGTARGVEALQILVEPPEEPTKTDLMLELLEGLDNRTLRMEQRQKAIEATLAELLALMLRRTAS